MELPNTHAHTGRESSKRNYYIISPRVMIIKAIIIIRNAHTRTHTHTKKKVERLEKKRKEKVERTKNKGRGVRKE